eukprot:4301815-Alexandrium_andersonii.AAC.1
MSGSGRGARGQTEARDGDAFAPRSLIANRLPSRACRCFFGLDVLADVLAGDVLPGTAAARPATSAGGALSRGALPKAGRAGRDLGNNKH